VKGVPAPPLGDPELGMLRMLGLHLHHDPLLAATLARVLRHMALAAAARGADDAQAAAAHAQARRPARLARARAHSSGPQPFAMEGRPVLLRPCRACRRAGGGPRLARPAGARGKVEA